jgi:acyl carrier protein
MSAFDFFALFNQGASEVSGRQFENLDRATVISELGLDSIAAIELIGYLEEKLKIRIPDEELAGVQTLGDLDDLVRRFTASGELP